MGNTRRGLEAAAKAVDAFRERMGYAEGDLDPESLLADLVTDLMHLADAQDISGEWLVERASDNYTVEGDDNPYGDEGQTEPDDPNIPAGAENPMDRCTIPCDGTGWTGNPRERCTTHYEL